MKDACRDVLCVNRYCLRCCAFDCVRRPVSKTSARRTAGGRLTSLRGRSHLSPAERHDMLVPQNRTKITR